MTTLKSQFAADEPVSGSWVSLSDPAISELVAGLGFDFVVVDTEHTSMSYESVEAHVRAVDAADGDTDTLVRVPWNDHVAVKRVLDTGAAGVMAPQVNTPEQAAELVEAVRYPPEGRRGVAGARASDYGRNMAEYVASAGDDIAVVAQVETLEAAENAADIAAVDGVDALLVGPADLSTSLGAFGEFDDPAFVDAIDRTLSGAESEGVPVGTLATNDAQIDRWVDAGFDFLIVGTDAGFVSSGAQAAKEAYESSR